MNTQFKELESYPAPNPYLGSDGRNWPTEVGTQEEHVELWADQWFEEHRVPSARGGYDTDDGDGPGYGNGRGMNVRHLEGVRACKTCGADVRAHGMHDEDSLNRHRAWHDELTATARVVERLDNDEHDY